MLKSFMLGFEAAYTVTNIIMDAIEKIEEANNEIERGIEANNEITDIECKEQNTYEEFLKWKRNRMNK